MIKGHVVRLKCIEISIAVDTIRRYFMGAPGLSRYGAQEDFSAHINFTEDKTDLQNECILHIKRNVT